MIRAKETMSALHLTPFDPDSGLATVAHLWAGAFW
jgi:hypothetical protein